MPSWNVHTAHVERLLARHEAEELGIGDVNAFLFGNYVPDIYVGFMVPDASFHIDYCLTHMAKVSVIPVPDAERYWDDNIRRRRPSSAAGLSLTLGAWAHLVADRAYNGRFRAFCKTHDVPKGEERRVGKQADFALFGRSLSISSIVEETPELLEAARAFRQYSIMPDDVSKSIQVATAIVQERGEGADELGYRLLSADWMADTFAECDAELSGWLTAWQRLEERGADVSAAAVHAELLKLSAAE